VEATTLASGPVVALVSIPQQTIYVYRNGILIGRSSLSSGKNASTPGGVFTILDLNYGSA
jgi:L,D-transpeptidase catalytic domain